MIEKLKVLYGVEKRFHMFIWNTSDKYDDWSLNLFSLNLFVQSDEYKDFSNQIAKQGVSIEPVIRFGKGPSGVGHLWGFWAYVENSSKDPIRKNLLYQYLRKCLVKLIDISQRFDELNGAFEYSKHVKDPYFKKNHPCQDHVQLNLKRYSFKYIEEKEFKDNKRTIKKCTPSDVFFTEGFAVGKPVDDYCHHFMKNIDCGIVSFTNTIYMIDKTIKLFSDKMVFGNSMRHLDTELRINLKSDGFCKIDFSIYTDEFDFATAAMNLNSYQFTKLSDHLVVLAAKCGLDYSIQHRHTSVNGLLEFDVHSANIPNDFDLLNDYTSDEIADMVGPFSVWGDERDLARKSLEAPTVERVKENTLVKTS